MRIERFAVWTVGVIVLLSVVMPQVAHAATLLRVSGLG